MTQFQDPWEQEIAGFMTPDMAADVRRYRCELDSTWREVSHLFERDYPGKQPGFEGHQLSGRALCGVAAVMLGEDPSEEPWN